jgi:hypothetical protein
MIRIAEIIHRPDRCKPKRIDRDQASVLVLLGLLAPGRPPVSGAEAARKVLDPGVPSDGPIKRWVDDDAL